MKSLIVVLLSLALSSAALANPGGTSQASRERPRSLKTMDVESNPMLYLLGIYGIEAQVGLTDRITFGPSAQYVDYRPLGGSLLNDKLRGYTIGARATGYLTGDRFTHSMIATLEANYLTFDYSFNDNLFSNIFGGPTTEYKAHITGVSGSALAGYQWNWGFGLNLTLAGGVSVSSIGKTELKSAGGSTRSENIPAYSGVLPSARVNVGFAF